jgi:hypothetical protein
VASSIITTGQLIAGHGYLASRWSHVGIVYRDPVTDVVLLLESTTMNTEKDILTGVARKGVQLVNMSSRVRNHNGHVCVRIPTKCPEDHQVLAMGEAVQKYKGLPYERDLKDLVDAVFDRLSEGDDTEDCSSLFCSELVALCLQAMGWLPAWVKSNDLRSPRLLGALWPKRMADIGHNRPADEWVPADFYHPQLRLLGTTLSLPIHIK